MAVGETRTFTIPAMEAYGAHDDAQVHRVPLSAVPDGVEVGSGLRGTAPDGRLTTFTGTEMDDECVTIDANHPLAGKDLECDITVMDIVQPQTAKETYVLPSIAIYSRVWREHMFTKTVGILSTLVLAVPAYAQEGAAEAVQQRQSAQQSGCLDRLNALAQRMDEDSYWLAGYSGYRVDAYGNAYPPRVPGVAAPGETLPGAAAPSAAEAVRPGGISPWANITWAGRPHYEIRTLFRAANILAGGGDEQGCDSVVNAAEQRYDSYTKQLADLGVDPQEIATWRQAELAAAVPVSETSFPRRVDDIMGADLRNVQDEDLGDVEDVVLDPHTGNILYVVVSRGGFFGIGSEMVAVPWDRLRVSPSMSTFVLPVDEAAIEQAPRVASETLVDPTQTGSIRKSDVESYWDQVLSE
ncbi:PRC-barrel domain-containing protein [Ensifer sp. LCM 4579]|uniref:PRC-barrel domain-containing protein n=1 Tax=Ensifer sp. LCM 4579 TaxID=1848292 RepID=UPI0008D9B4D5|nr:PRC-barrel domain-containing protein [Ensifer sp. LCM 4579]OHV72601.1 hypothetical protein LCM4579_10845 [Ensifer sp. LCM 4579]